MEIDNPPKGGSGVKEPKPNYLIIGGTLIPIKENTERRISEVETHLEMIELRLQEIEKKLTYLVAQMPGSQGWHKAKKEEEDGE